MLHAVPTLPDPLPRPTDHVILCYGNPLEIGTPLNDMVMLVLGADAEGNVIGAATAIMNGPQGPSVVQLPVLNCPYSKERKALTWRWLKDALAPTPAPVLRVVH